MIDGQSWMVKFTCIWRYIQASNEGAPRPNDCGPNSLIYISNDSSHAHLKKKTSHLTHCNSLSQGNCSPSQHTVPRWQTGTSLLCQSPFWSFGRTLLQFEAEQWVLRTSKDTKCCTKRYFTRRCAACQTCERIKMSWTLVRKELYFTLLHCAENNTDI